jgi:hypothetical protein
MLMRFALPVVLATVLSSGVMCVAAGVKIERVNGQADLGTIELHGVAAGGFDPAKWESGTLNFVPDVRMPLIEPRKGGVYRNIYAPSAVETPDGWRLFYGAWDGVDTTNDRIYSVTTRDFVDFADRRVEIDHGDFIHVCNVSAIKVPDGDWRLMCTCYPTDNDRNKPGLFVSADGRSWNGSIAPYKAKKSDIVTIDGYDKYPDADINGMNVLLYEDGAYRLYFNNFRDFGRVYRATAKDGKRFAFDGSALEFPAVVNDVKKFTVGGRPWYLMGLHMNRDRLWYSLSRDGMTFGPALELAKNLGERDRYIVAVGWVTKGNRVLGFLYGAGEAPTLERNRIWGRWLQKKVVFVSNDMTRYEAAGALGPDRQIFIVPRERVPEGHFEVYAEDGVTRIGGDIAGKLQSGGVYVLGEAK